MEYRDFKANTTYKLSVLAIEKNGNTYKNSKEYKTAEYTYTKKLLEFPMITANGICNVKVECNQDDSKSYYIYDKSMGSTTNPNSIPIEAYDGDINTYVGPYYTTAKELSIDSSVIGKKITIKSNGGYQTYGLDEYSTYKTYKQLYECRNTTCTVTVPNGAEQYLFYCYGNEGNKIYEITVSD